MAFDWEGTCVLRLNLCSNSRCVWFVCIVMKGSYGIMVALYVDLSFRCRLYKIQCTVQLRSSSMIVWAAACKYFCCNYIQAVVESMNGLQLELLCSLHINDLQPVEGFSIALQPLLHCNLYRREACGLQRNGCMVFGLACMWLL